MKKHRLNFWGVNMVLALSMCMSIATAHSAPQEAMEPPFAYSVHATHPVDTLLVLPEKTIGGALRSFAGQKFHTSTGAILIVLSKMEQAYYKDGKLKRYHYVQNDGVAQRATPSVSLQLSLSVGQKAVMYYFEPELFRDAGKHFGSFNLKKVDGKPFTVKYDATAHVYSFIVGENE